MLTFPNAKINLGLNITEKETESSVCIRQVWKLREKQRATW